MPRLIFKCPYLPPGAKRDRGGYAAYIATRDGVELVPDAKRQLPATEQQRTLIARILRDFPSAKEFFEYEDYLENPTRGNASEFIGLALEDNRMAAEGRAGYASYVAQRPGVARMGTHGLFGAEDGPIVLSQVAEEIRNHPGNVWVPILSLRREDAARLGYDNAENWRALLRAHADTFAKHLKIPLDDLVWYAAFHDEGHHPHVHMLCYSKDPSKGFLTKDGIRGIKSELVRDLFRCDLEEIYQRQTLYRTETNTAARETLRMLAEGMQNGVLDNTKVMELMEELAGRLRHHSGKLVYGYLRPPVKALVDRVVDALEKDPRVAAAYASWWKERQAVVQSYRDTPEPYVPLSRNKEFKSIRNLVVREAVNLMRGDLSLASESHPQMTDKMKSGDLEELTSAAEAGSAYAQFLLGRFYLFGDAELRDEQTAAHWLTLAADRGNAQAGFLLSQRDQWARGAVLLAGTRLLAGIGRVFSATPPPARDSGKRMVLDRKRHRELLHKKGRSEIHLPEQEQEISLGS